jgi:hypothetical protein
MVGFMMIIKSTAVSMSDGADICRIIEHLKVDGGYTWALSPSPYLSVAVSNLLPLQPCSSTLTGRQLSSLTIPHRLTHASLTLPGLINLLRPTP